MVAHAPDFELVGEAADGERAVAVAQAERPDVFLIDSRLPGVDGIEATRRIMADSALVAVRVVILTIDLDEHVYNALRVGASGFLRKDITAASLIDAVRVVAAGDALLAPRSTRRVIEHFVTVPAAGAAGPGTDPSGLRRLTGRER